MLHADSRRPDRRPPVRRQGHGGAPGKLQEHQRSTPQPGKCIQLSWAKDVTGEFNVELRVELEHQRGLIALLATSVNAADGNIEKISMDERDGRISVVQLVVSVHDRVHLARVIKKLRALKGVIRITRLRS